MADAHGGVREAFFSLAPLSFDTKRVGETEVNEDHRSPLSVQSSQSIPTVSGLCRDDRTAFAGVCFWGSSAHHGLHCTCPLMTQSGYPARVQGLGTLDLLTRPLRSIGAAFVHDGLRASDAPLLYQLACAGERFAGTSEDVLMTFSCRRDIPSNCAFSSIARDRW